MKTRHGCAICVGSSTRDQGGSCTLHCETISKYAYTCALHTTRTSHDHFLSLIDQLFDPLFNLFFLFNMLDSLEHLLASSPALLQ